VAGVPFQHHAITHAYGTVKGHSIELHTLQMAAERLRALTEDMKTAERSAAPQPTAAPGGRRRRASSPKCDFSTQALLGLFSKRDGARFQHTIVSLLGLFSKQGLLS